MASEKGEVPSELAVRKQRGRLRCDYKVTSHAKTSGHTSQILEIHHQVLQLTVGGSNIRVISVLIGIPYRFMRPVLACVA